MTIVEISYDMIVTSYMIVETSYDMILPSYMIMETSYNMIVTSYIPLTVWRLYCSGGGRGSSYSY